MLAGLLMAGIIVAPLATIALFLPVPKRLGAGALMWTRRLVLAVLGTALLAVVAGGSLFLLSYSRTTCVVAAIVIAAASAVWLPATRRWNARAHVCWSLTVYLFVIYLIFMLNWTFASPLGIAGMVGAMLLWLLEILAAVLACAYLWELCDALGREHWTRRVRQGVATSDLPELRSPYVSLHVPAHEEPPDMVIETLASLTGLDYDNYEIVVIDDNTTDETLWRPLEQWCHEHDITFAHLADWPGYKSGALNYALRELTDDRAELIGVVDSDYQIDPEFLKRCAPLFTDSSVGFIQAPQDYRDWENAPFYRRLYYSYKYFFAVSQPSRNERDGAIFAGTMGLIRRSALEKVGGWDEWCITEDAELSLRLLRAGWSGLHVDATFGRGVMPLSFEALKGQRFRWCFGGIQILRQHWRSMLPGPLTAENRLTTGQRWAYLSGAVQWYGDLLALIFYFFLLAGAANIAFGGGLLFRKLTAFLLAVIPLMVALGLVRAVTLIRRGTGASWSDALGAFMIWQSTSLVVARASLQALFAKRAEFLRTPKTTEQSRWWDAVRGNKAETLLAVLGLAGIAAALVHASSYGGPITAALLVFPTIAFASAPLNSLAAQRAALPPELAARRRTEWRRGYYARRSATAVLGLGAAGAAIAVVVGLLSPGHEPVSPPHLVGPAPGPASTPTGPTSPTRTTPSGPTASTGPSTGSTTGPTTSPPTSPPTTGPTTSPPTTGPTTSPPTTGPTTSPPTTAPSSSPTTTAASTATTGAAARGAHAQGH